jgi:hypothetical protein
MKIDIKELKEIISHMELMEKIGTNDDDILYHLLNYLYDCTDKRLLELFIKIDEIEKLHLRRKEQILALGLQDAVHAIAAFSRDISLKNLEHANKQYFEDDNYSIPFLINIIKAHFPDGISDDKSPAVVEVFNKFLNLLVKNKERFLTGVSSNWSKDYGHYDYLKLVLEKNLEDK